jgi:hypothetical protein
MVKKGEKKNSFALSDGERKNKLCLQEMYESFMLQALIFSPFLFKKLQKQFIS